jgi:hypothetical protein
LSAAGEDVGAFITVSGLLIGSTHPVANDISSRVKKPLGFFFNARSGFATCAVLYYCAR